MPGSSRHPSPSSITACFFYTRTVPCEFWFLDRAKPLERRDKVFMIDAGHVYRRVTREIYDFSPERLANLSTNEYEILLAPGEIRARFDEVAGPCFAQIRTLDAQVSSLKNRT